MTDSSNILTTPQHNNTLDLAPLHTTPSLATTHVISPSTLHLNTGMAHSARLAAPTFDVESCSSNYDGPLQPLRLAHIAMHCPSLSRQALSIAITSAKSCKDVSLYRRLLSLASILNLNDLATADVEWTDKTEDANRRESARLEQELKGYKNNLIKESIRVCVLCIAQVFRLLTSFYRLDIAIWASTWKPPATSKELRTPSFVCAPTRARKPT